MTKAVLFLAFLLVFSSVSAKPLFPRRLATGFTPTLEGANGPSVRGVVAQSGADYIVDTILPILTQRLTNIHLPDVNGGSTISYSLTNIVVQKVAIGAITTSMIVSPKVNVVDVSATITGDWSAQCCCVWKWCVTASGGVEVDISGSSLAISGDVTTTPDGHPQFTNVVVGTYINNMDVHVSGSLLSGLLDLIISAVKGRIRDAAQDSVSDALKSLVSVTANHILASLPVSIKVTDPFPLLIDFSLTENPTFAPAAPGYGSVSMHGCFQDPDNPQPAPLPHVPLPTGIPAAYMGEADIDQYIFNSGLLLQYQKSPVNVTVYNSDKEIPFKLVTDTFKAPIPPLYRTFPGYTVAWRFIQDSPFSLQITEKAADVTAVFNWTFLVSNDPNPDDHLKVYQEAFVLRTQFDLTAALNIVGTATLPAIHLFAAPTSVVLELASTNIGDFDTSLFQTFVQVVVGTLPLKLDRTVPLPVVDGAALVGPQVQYGVGFMSIFSNFSYTPPTALLTKLDALVLDSVSIDV